MLAQERLNLPQRAERLVVAPEARDRLRVSGAGTFEADILETLPTEYRTVCSDVVRAWGGSARGTSRWSVRVLREERGSPRSSILVGLRCGSSHPDYTKYSDERVALLIITGSGAHLQLIPAGEDCANCTELSAVEFAGAHPAEGATLWEVRGSVSNDNPCCALTHENRSERLVMIRVSDGRVALDTETRREIREHDDEAGDTEEICRSEAAYQKDAIGKLTGLTLATRCTLDGKPQEEKLRSFRWNAGRRIFEEQQ